MNQVEQLDYNQSSVKSPNLFEKIHQYFWNSTQSEALVDIIQGLKKWRLWTTMASADVRRRYRRTVIGPFWTTLSLAIFIGCTSVLFARLWKMEVATYIPFFSSGFISWTFISSLIIEGCSVFIMSEGLLKQISLPYSLFVWHLIARNLLVLGHHAVVYVLIVLCFQVPINLNIFYLIPALILLSLTAGWVVMVVGLVSARYRDMQQVISSILQISIFVTPIFWPPAQLGTTLFAKVFVNVNVLYHYLSLIRLPLIGQSPSLLNWMVALAVTIVGWIFAFSLFAKKRKQLIFWL